MPEVYQDLGEGDLRRLSAAFARRLKKNDVCLLYGEMGAGKTFFTAGVVAALGGDMADFSSPTFNLTHIYTTSLGLFYHVDLYRLTEVIEEDDISQDMWLEPRGGLSFIEWAERLGDWKPTFGYRLFFEHAEKGRNLRIEAVG